MAAIRYGIAGQPVDHSLSPLLVALVARHLNLPVSEKELTMELVEVSTVPDAFAWGYAGALPEPIPWAYTNSVFNKFRTKALLKKAIDAALQIDECHPELMSEYPTRKHADAAAKGLPSRMFDQEIWINLTAPLKHQLDSGAVQAVDDSMRNKCVNALRWDGRGWWCAGLDGEGVLDVLWHHGFEPEHHVLGLIGGGGAARSTAAAWVAAGGRLHPLSSRRPLEEGPWSARVTTDEPTVTVDFDGTGGEAHASLLKSTYAPMEGSTELRIKAMVSRPLDGRWLLVAQHLACWRTLWAPERADDLPTLGHLLTQLLEAETVLASYA